MSKSFNEYKTKLKMLKINNFCNLEHTINNKEYAEKYKKLNIMINDIDLNDDCDLDSLFFYENWLKEQ